MITATFKIGLNKGKKRIWIDGKRLIDAGFLPGRQFKCEALPGEINCVMMPAAPGKWRKVSGRPGGKPIIDMLGRDVELAFPTETHVTVRFHSAGMIFIRPASEQTLATKAA